MTPVPAADIRRCPACDATVAERALARAFQVCPRCGHHWKLGAGERIRLLVDPGSFVERDTDLEGGNPVAFDGYPARLAAARRHTRQTEAVRAGRARIEGRPIALAVFDFGFLGGTMGAVVGERVARLIEHAARARVPLVVCTASGGARLQEGIVALLQIAKLTAALDRLRRARVPFVSILTDPTTGGVAASIALLADVNLAEPGALIGFAGPRVIEQTLHQNPPAGFQRAEFVLAHGFVDRIVPRKELRTTVARILDLLHDARRPRARAVAGADRALGHRSSAPRGVRAQRTRPR